VSEKEQISCIALSAVLRSVGLRGERIPELEQRTGMSCGKLLDPGCWLSRVDWELAADVVEELCSPEKDLFLTAGRRLSELGLMGAMEFLPWFLSSPQLVLRNIAVFQDRLDAILEPEVDFVTESSCRIGFIPREGCEPPKRLLYFLQGYVEAVVGLWDCTIGYSSATWEEGGGNWYVHIEWKAPRVRYRRALEELFVDSDFFSVVVDELFKISRRRSERLSEMLRLNQSLRRIALKRVKDGEISLEKLGQGDTDHQYLGLFSTVNDGIFRIKPDGTMLDANAATLTILGYGNIEEMLRQVPNVELLLGRGTSFTRIVAKFRQQGVLRNHPIQIRDRYGSRLELMVSAYRNRDPKSGLEVIEGVLHDVTDTRKVRQALGHTHSFLEAVFDHSPSGLMVVDSEGRIIKVNTQLQEMFGFDPTGIVGSERYSVFDDKVLKESGIVGITQRALEGETVQAPSIQIKENSTPFCAGVGSPLYLSVSAYPLRLEENRISHAVVSYTDITENYLIEQQISQLHKLQSIHTLASGIAHDFNNILAAIVPSAEMILARINEKEMVERKAKTIMTAARRAAALTSQLLSFARESRGDKKMVGLNESVEEAMELIDNVVPKKIVLAFKPDKGIPKIAADTLQLQQVVINLIINACDASPRGGTITIKTFEETLRERVTFGGKIITQGRFVGLSVDDEGVGMPPEVVQRVFDPFFTTKEKGTGLGLSVSYRIVQEHGGDIAVETRKGEGSTFTVLLPAGGNRHA
jgi:PAS domain S-box-containing protein